MQGRGLDIGFAGYEDGCSPILEGAIGIDKNYPGYDGLSLPFLNDTQDYVYSSHCLEHIDNFKRVILEWHRVVKINGYIIITVPHQYAYEKRVSLPSRFNADHKRFYTPSKLLNEVEESLEPNSYRIVSLRDNVNTDLINYPPQKHSNGPYEIELVIKKIQKPNWTMED
jgi:SAM-dependent methyltransferase